MRIFKEKISSLDFGLTLVEVIIAVSIILVFLIVLFSVNTLYIKTAFENTGSVQATLLAEEGIEAVRFLKNASWADNIAVLTSGTNYSLTLQTNNWELVTSNIYIDNRFERIVTFSDVYRDLNGDIVTGGGSLDPNTKLVTATVSWLRATATTSKSISAYITNIYEN